MIHEVESRGIIANVLLFHCFEKEVVEASFVVVRQCFDWCNFSGLYLLFGPSFGRGHGKRHDASGCCGRDVYQISFHHLCYFSPVCPYPPVPLSVSSSVSTSSKHTFSCLAITICAMRSPSFTVKGSLEKFTSSTISSPR